MKRRPNRKKDNMKARFLLLTIGAAMATVTFSASASDALLSPRAAGNQIKQVSGLVNDSTFAGTTAIAVAPRVAGNQIAKVSGTNSEVTPAAACARNMSGSPKTLQACTEHPGAMPGCNAVTVAPLK